MTKALINHDLINEKVKESYTDEKSRHSYLNAILEKFPNLKINLFTGGSDIDPALYGQKKSPRCGRSFENRDKQEVADFKKAMETLDENVINFGICRGAQLLCALSGGDLIQHVENHYKPHSIEAYDGETYQVTSVHHQMMYPYNLPRNKYSLLGWSIARSNTYIVDYGEAVDKSTGLPLTKFAFSEPEVVWFPETRSLCIQSHPEYTYTNQTRFHDFILKIVTEILNNEL